MGYCRVWPGSRMSPRRTVRRQNNCFKFCLGRVSQHPLLSSSVTGIKLLWPMKSPGRKFWQFSFIFRIKKIHLLIYYVLVRACPGMCTHMPQHTRVGQRMTSRKQFSPCASKCFTMNSGYQSWWQSPVPSEPYCCPQSNFFHRIHL